MKIVINNSLYILNSDICDIRLFGEANNINLKDMSLYYNSNSKKASDFLLVEGKTKDFIMSQDYIINFDDCMSLSDEEIDKEIETYYDDIDRIINNTNYDNLRESNIEIAKYQFIIKQLKKIKAVKKGKSKIIFPDFIQDKLPKTSELRFKKLIKSLTRLR